MITLYGFVILSNILHIAHKCSFNILLKRQPHLQVFSEVLLVHWLGGSQQLVTCCHLGKNHSNASCHEAQVQADLKILQLSLFAWKDTQKQSKVIYKFHNFFEIVCVLNNKTLVFDDFPNHVANKTTYIDNVRELEN